MTEVTKEQISTYTAEDVKESWLKSQAFVQRNVICIALFDSLNSAASNIPNLPYYEEAIKATVGLHARKITGLKDGVFLDTENDIILYEDIEPVFTFGERFGKPIYNLFEVILHQNRKLGNKQASYTFNEDRIRRNVINFQLLFIEPDPTHTRVVSAWLLKDVYVKSVKGDDGRRDLTAELNSNYKTIVTFGGTTARGETVIKTAEEEFGKLSSLSANPYSRTGYVTSLDDLCKEVGDAAQNPVKYDHPAYPSEQGSVNTPNKFAPYSVIEHYKGGIYFIVGLPESNVLEETRESSYAYLMEDGRICHRSKAAMEEEGKFRAWTLEDYNQKKDKIKFIDKWVSEQEVLSLTIKNSPLINDPTIK